MSSNIRRNTTTWGGVILEAGCGEGYMSEHIYNFTKSYVRNVNITGFDISEQCIRDAVSQYPHLDFFVHDIYNPIELNVTYDLIVCCEVLEHLANPREGINNLMNYSDKFIFSVPHEPIWRILNIMRGKYLKNLGNTPGHIQHFSKRQFINLLENCGLKIISLRYPFPWLMGYCEKNNGMVKKGTS